MTQEAELRGFLFLHNIVPEAECASWAAKMSPAIEDLIGRLGEVENLPDDGIQTIFYDVGKQYIGSEKGELRVYFRILYAVVWGTYSGPRWGLAFNLLGQDKFISLMKGNYYNLRYVAIQNRDTPNCYEDDDDQL